MPLHTALRAEKKNKSMNEGLRRRSLIHMDDADGNTLFAKKVAPRNPSKVGKMRRTSHWIVHIVHVARLVAWRAKAKHASFERARRETHKVVVKIVEKWWKRNIERQRYIKMKAFMGSIGLNLWVYKMRIQIIRKRLNVRRIIHFCQELQGTGGIMGRRIMNAVHKLNIRIKRMQRVWRSWKHCTNGRIKGMRLVVEKLERTHAETLQQYVTHKNKHKGIKTEQTLAERRQQKELAEMEAKFARLAGGSRGNNSRKSSSDTSDVRLAYRRLKAERLLQLLEARRQQYMAMIEHGHEEMANELPFELQQMANSQPKKQKKKKNTGGQFDMESIKAIMHGQRRFSAVFFGRKDEASKTEERVPFLFWTQLMSEPKLLLKLIKKCMVDSGYAGETP
jgi:hypothetical protein